MKNKLFSILFVLLFVVLTGCSNNTQKHSTKKMDIFDEIVEHNQTEKKIKVRIEKDRNIRVYQPIANERIVEHSFIKNQNDDLVIYAGHQVGRMVDDKFVSEQYVNTGSNKAFAFRIKPKDGTKLIWFPEHEGIGSAFAQEQELFFDGIKQDFTKFKELTEVNQIEIKQKIFYKHPESDSNLANLMLTTTINNEGVHYNGNIQWQPNIIIERGYVAMLPSITPPFVKLFDEKFNSYGLQDTGVTDIFNGGSIYGFSTEKYQDTNEKLVFIQKINNFNETYRDNKEGRREPFLWLEHRSKDIHKLYPQIYSNYVTSDENYSFSFSYFTGFSESPNL